MHDQLLLMVVVNRYFSLSLGATGSQLFDTVNKYYAMDCQADMRAVILARV